MTVAIQRLCFSNDPFCTGARPCTPCFEQLKVVLGSALFRCGVDELVAAGVVNAFALSITESVYNMLRQLDITASAEAAYEPPAAPAPDDIVSPSGLPSSLDVKAMMEQAMASLGPGELKTFCGEILNGTLEGWDLLSETERVSMRELAHKLVGSATTRQALSTQTKKVKAKIQPKTKAKKTSGVATAPKGGEVAAAAPPTAAPQTAPGSDAPAAGRVDTASVPAESLPPVGDMIGISKNGTAQVAAPEGN
jgi:hypothetical protein